jgi:hypothetical protein
VRLAANTNELRHLLSGQGYTVSDLAAELSTAAMTPYVASDKFLLWTLDRPGAVTVVLRGTIDGWHLTQPKRWRGMRTFSGPGRDATATDIAAFVRASLG